MRLADRVDSRDNNFDVLRLAAAAAVLVSHSWSLTGRPEPSFAGDTLGGLGVTVFFAISGFLVARSWHLDPRLAAFVTKRVLRLWPALIVVLLLTSLVVGALVSERTLGDYYGSGQVASYALENVGLHIRYLLPGVFAHNPYPDAVNGSLWTLPIEVKAYVLLLVLGLAHLVRRPIVLLAVLALVIWMLVTDAGTRPRVVAHWLEGPLQTRLLAVFIGGALLYAVRERVRLDWRLALIALGVVWLKHGSSPGVRTTAWALTVPYIVAFAAYMSPASLRALVRPGDLSYGIYLWAFPVQQTVMFTDTSLPPGILLLIAAPVTWTIALASWRLVEAPALRLKRRLPLRAAARPTVAA